MRELDRYELASAEFESRLRAVEDWTLSTPCAEWNVRQLVNHVVRGNLNYIALLEGVVAEEFLRLREVDALGDDPEGAYGSSVRGFVTAFGQPGALQRGLDYPLGTVSGEQALAVRTVDTVIHAWDLATAIGGDDRLNPELVEWVDGNLHQIYAGLEGMDRFFGKSQRNGASKQEKLLRRMGR